MTLTDYRRKVTEQTGTKNLLSKQLEDENTSLSTQQNKLQAVEKAQVFIQKVAKDTQEQLRFQISDIVQLALDAVFSGEYEFNVNFEIKRNKTEASLVFMKDNKEVDPMSASGGGVVDLAAFALRISAWSLGHSDNVIILDEPFRFLSKDLQPRAGEIMRELSHRLNIQFIMVTHAKEMIEISDRVFEVSQIDGISKVVTK